MQTTKSQTELIQRKPILSARQVAVAVIFGAIAAAFELLQITIPGYLPGVNFSLSGIWLTLSTMIGGPLPACLPHPEYTQTARCILTRDGSSPLLPVLVVDRALFLRPEDYPLLGADYLAVRLCLLGLPGHLLPDPCHRPGNCTQVCGPAVALAVAKGRGRCSSQPSQLGSGLFTVAQGRKSAVQMFAH